MFKFILRRTILKSLDKDEQDMAMLLKDQIKIDFIALMMLAMFWSIPMASIISLFIEVEHTVLNIIEFIIILGAYCIFAIWFLKKFIESINVFKTLISARLYSSLYTVKGKAILSEDFSKIKEENERLYEHIMSQKCRGYCYAICFNILKCLKKGKIKFIAVKSLKADETNKYYTMHVLYVNGDWCFDTYSQKQYLVDELMRSFKAKEYTSYSYSDVESKSYEDFRKEKYPELKKWCEENDCHQVWIKE